MAKASMERLRPINIIESISSAYHNPGEDAKG
jgi:hypothetical protein